MRESAPTFRALYKEIVLIIILMHLVSKNLNCSSCNISTGKITNAFCTDTVRLCNAVQASTLANLLAHSCKIFDVGIGFSGKKAFIVVSFLHDILHFEFETRTE